MYDKKLLRKKCTMLVSSCDAYEDCWYPFFKLLKIQWPNMPFNIVLNSEKKGYSYEGFRIKSFQLYSPNEVAWGKRLKETLKRIKTKYIFFMMDDFFLNEPVDEEKIYQCIDWMDKDSSIQVFSFYYVPGNGIKDSKYPGFVRRQQIGKYRYNCQAAVWRREALIKAMRDFEDPWEWEDYGNWRSFWQIGKKYYTLEKGAPLILNYVYDNPAKAEIDAMWRGKWVRPYVEPLFQKYGIEMDLSKRGFCSKRLYCNLRPEPQNVKRRSIESWITYYKDIFKGVSKRWRHLI